MNNSNGHAKANGSLGPEQLVENNGLHSKGGLAAAGTKEKVCQYFLQTVKTSVGTLSAKESEEDTRELSCRDLAADPLVSGKGLVCTFSR